MKRKIKAFLMAVVMALACLSFGAIEAGAESIFDVAESMGENDSVTAYVTDKDFADNPSYKIDLSSDGILNFTIFSKKNSLDFRLLDSNGNKIDTDKAFDLTETQGTFYSSMGDYLCCTWNSVTERINVSFSFNLKKSTYYVQISEGYSSRGNSETKITTSFISTESKAATAVAIQVELPKGSTMQLNAILAPTDSTSDVVWSSSKKSVATVSESGKVTAVKKGSCYIYAKANGHKTKIRVKVV